MYMTKLIGTFARIFTAKTLITDCTQFEELHQVVEWINLYVHIYSYMLSFLPHVIYTIWFIFKSYSYKSIC
jgi:hypothetical protein